MCKKVDKIQEPLKPHEKLIVNGLMFIRQGEKCEKVKN